MDLVRQLVRQHHLDLVGRELGQQRVAQHEPLRGADARDEGVDVLDRMECSSGAAASKIGALSGSSAPYIAHRGLRSARNSHTSTCIAASRSRRCW